MRYLIFVTLLWAFSFNLIGAYLAGQVDSYFAVLTRVLLAGVVFLPLTRWRGVAPGFIGGVTLVGALQFGGGTVQEAIEALLQGGVMLEHLEQAGSAAKRYPPKRYPPLQLAPDATRWVCPRCNTRNKIIHLRCKECDRRR